MPAFLHIADLHLGRFFHGESLLEDQDFLIGQILKLCEKTSPDALFLAGDIFDRAIPPVDAVALFDRFLLSLSRMNCRVIAIPGNHDSAGRLAYASAAWETLGVHLRADFHRINEPITIQGKNGEEVDVFAFPFADAASLREGQPGEADKNQLILESMERIRAARRSGVPAVLVAHEFLAGASESGSERVYVGGSLSVPGEHFHGFDYVALGHLHSHQKVGNDFIRYSGSPMAYSFDEAGKAKGALLVRLGEGNLYPFIDFHELNPLRPLVVLEGPLRRLLDDSEFRVHVDSYVSARVTDGLSHLNLIGTLRERFPYLREIRRPALEAVMNMNGDSPRDTSVLETPETVFTDFLSAAGWENESEIKEAHRHFYNALDLVRQRERESLS